MDFFIFVRSAILEFLVLTPFVGGYLSLPILAFNAIPFNSEDLSRICRVAIYSKNNQVIPKILDKNILGKEELSESLDSAIYSKNNQVVAQILDKNILGKKELSESLDSAIHGENNEVVAQILDKNILEKEELSESLYYAIHRENNGAVVQILDEDSLSEEELLCLYKKIITDYHNNSSAKNTNLQLLARLCNYLQIQKNKEKVQEAIKSYQEIVENIDEPLLRGFSTKKSARSYTLSADKTIDSEISSSAIDSNPSLPLAGEKAIKVLEYYSS